VFCDGHAYWLCNVDKPSSTECAEFHKQEFHKKEIKSVDLKRLVETCTAASADGLLFSSYKTERKLEPTDENFGPTVCVSKPTQNSITARFWSPSLDDVAVYSFSEKDIPQIAPTTLRDLMYEL
jgi:hypothetical protein